MVLVAAAISLPKEDSNTGGQRFGPSMGRFGAPFGWLLLVAGLAAALTWGFYQWASIPAPVEPPYVSTTEAPMSHEAIAAELKKQSNEIQQNHQRLDLLVKMATAIFGVVSALLGWAIVSGLTVMGKLIRMDETVELLKEEAQTQRTALTALNNDVGRTKFMVEFLYEHNQPKKRPD